MGQLDRAGHGTTRMEQTGHAWKSEGFALT